MRRSARVLMTVLALGAMPMATPSFGAQGSQLAVAYNDQTDLDFRKGLQIRLSWTGDYAGAFDGHIAASSLRAIRDFQARHGMVADGVIDEAMLRLLIQKSDGAEAATGMALIDDAVTGQRVPLPMRLVEDLGPTDVGHLWRAADKTVEIETVRIAGTGQTLRGLFDVLSTPTPDRSVANAEFGGEWFTLDGNAGDHHYVMRFSAKGGDLRGFSVSYAKDRAKVMRPYVAVAGNLFEPFAGEPHAPLVASREPNAFSALLARSHTNGAFESRYAMASVDPKQPNLFEMPSPAPAKAAPAPVPQKPEFDMAGSGFVVSSDGWLLTNAHVVRACTSVLVGEQQVATKTILDTDNDLALVKVDGVVGEPLTMSVTKPRLGEDVLALGYPLRSILADSLNVTRGNVSSLLGLANDERYLQISAPVQPGNSGGPLVDLAGRVVGVVTAKLNAVAVADATGDIPQSINFAVRPDAAVAFLDRNAVAYETADASLPLESVPDATAAVKDSVLPIICVGR